MCVAIWESIVPLWLIYLLVAVLFPVWSELLERSAPVDKTYGTRCVRGLISSSSRVQHESQNFTNRSFIFHSILTISYGSKSYLAYLPQRNVPFVLRKRHQELLLFQIYYWKSRLMFDIISFHFISLYFIFCCVWDSEQYKHIYFSI